MFAIAMTCVVAGNVGAQVDGPRIVKNVNVIADVGGGTLTTTTSDPLPTPFSSFPDGFLAATKYCYFVAETPDQGRELCRFASSTTPTTYDKIDVFEITPDAGSTAPDLLTLVGDHLYFRASAHANRPLMHHKDGEVRTGVTPKVDPLTVAQHRTNAIAAAGDRLLVLHLHEDPGANDPDSRVSVVQVLPNGAHPTPNPLTILAYEAFEAGPQSAVDLVDCGLAEALATATKGGFAVYRDLNATPTKAWRLAYESGMVTTKAIDYPSGTPLTGVDRIVGNNGAAFLFQNNGAAGWRLYRFDGTSCTAISDGAGAVLDVRLAQAFSGCLWFTRGPALGPQTLWRTDGGPATGVPLLDGVSAPRIVTSLAVHEEHGVTSDDDSVGEPEPHLYLLGTRVGTPSDTRLWRVAGASPGDGGAVTAHVCGTESPSTAYVNASNLVSLVGPKGRYLGFLAADVQGGVLRWSVAFATEGTNDGDPTTMHNFAHQQLVLAPLDVAASPSLLTPFLRNYLGNQMPFVLLRAQHATDGVHVWRVHVQ